MNGYKLSADKYQRQFPNSNIAKKYTLGPTKLFYIINHPQAPYYRILINFLISLENWVQTKFTACFDEAFNDVSYCKQIGLYVIYLDE